MLFRGVTCEEIECYSALIDIDKAWDQSFESSVVFAALNFNVIKILFITNSYKKRRNLHFFII